MRWLIAFLTILSVGLFGGTAVGVLNTAYALSAQQPPRADINVDINTRGGGDWWTNPVWIAIGVLALVLLIVIIAMMTRGGGTTIIKE
jgi:H+/Cl- antiporter ClcA